MKSLGQNKKDKRWLVLFALGILMSTLCTVKYYAKTVESGRYLTLYVNKKIASVPVLCAKRPQDVSINLFARHSFLHCNAEIPARFSLFLHAPLPVNRATPETLTLLPGIGPLLAQRIVQYREIHGPLKNMDDFNQIRGIGRAAITRLLPLVCFTQ